MPLYYEGILFRIVESTVFASATSPFFMCDLALASACSTDTFATALPRFISSHYEIVTYRCFSKSMFMFSCQVLKETQMSEILTILTSATGHPLVEGFNGKDLTQPLRYWT